MGGSFAMPRMPSVPKSCRSGARAFVGAGLPLTCAPFALLPFALLPRGFAFAEPDFFVVTTSAAMVLPSP